MLLLKAPEKPARVGHRLLEMDIRDFCNMYHGLKFHFVLTDPPYHLEPQTKRWGQATRLGATKGVYARHARGFMNTSWDGGDIAFDPDTWAAIGDHMLAGAFGAAFASSRGWHRLACAIEDAGFIIHPSIFGYGYGSGFPKATRIDTQIERQQPVTGSGSRGVSRNVYGKWASDEVGRFPLTQPMSGAALEWYGHRYGLQALKPALEPIIIFQKPYDRRPVDNITATGAGAFWIDGGRIGNRSDNPQKMGGKITGSVYGKINVPGGKLYTEGRWPANLVLTHQPGCTPDRCQPDCPASLLGAQTGLTASHASDYNWAPFVRNNPTDFITNKKSGIHFEDEGTAARYFYQAEWFDEVEAALTGADPLFYSGKATTEERDRGLDEFDLQTVNDGRQTPIDNAYQRGGTPRRNIHPTVKPIGLTTWLARLFLPPAGYQPRRVLIPFAGSGSEVIGAIRAGWESTIGVELDTDYAMIARQRISYYTDPLRSLMRAVRSNASAEYQQLELLG